MYPSETEATDVADASRSEVPTGREHPELPSAVITTGAAEPLHVSGYDIRWRNGETKE
jgi:hypothetical protein